MYNLNSEANPGEDEPVTGLHMDKFRNFEKRFFVLAATYRCDLVRSTA